MLHLRFFLVAIATNLIFFTGTLSVKAQNTANSFSGPRNTINAYIGLIEYNINYERNILQKSKSYSNIRFGFGHGQFFVAGEGKYINTAFVHLMGEKNSHMEIDVGVKCMVTNSITDPKLSDTFIPDIFFGYRFEKPSRGFILRTGFNYPTLINLGIGYKF